MDGSDEQDFSLRLSAAADFQMGDLIGRIVCGYRVVAQIGSGGMGKVYLAESAFLTEYKQQVAIKTLTAQAEGVRQAALLRDLFVREANIQVQLKHPHIVNVIQFAVEGDELFLLLEYVPGYRYRGRRIGNVAEMIEYETGPIPHPRALRLFVQALEAMSYAHSFRYRWEGEERVGLVHRDIKPSNLLLMDPETVKLSDFGIVKVRQRASTLTAKLTPGTSAYMSPEAIIGPGQFGLSELDARSDIYALGVTLYEMLTGHLPFSPDHGINPDLALRRKHVDQPPPPPSAFYPAVPPRLDRVVLRALEKHPQRRYQTAAEFKQAVLEFAGEHSAASTSILSPESAPPPVAAQRATAAETHPAPPPAAVAVAAPAAASAASLQAVPARSPVGRPARTIYLLITLVLALGILGITAAIMWRRAATSALKAESNPARQPSASRAPSSLAPAPAGMVLISGGSFPMGRNLSEAEKEFEAPGQNGKGVKVFVYDYPAHEVKVAPFYLDKTEVSNRDYANFVRATNHAPPTGWRGAEPPEGAEDLPVTYVSYRDATEYCAWRGEQQRDGVHYRLPTEEEWEYAARGPGAEAPWRGRRLFPWGDEWKLGLANTKESRLNHPQIVTANRDGASMFGVFNLSGNVAEWTATDFNHYPGSDRQTPREPGYSGTYQVVRGGSFDYPKEWAMTTTRAWARPTEKGPSIGFRCAAELKR